MSTLEYAKMLMDSVGENQTEFLCGKLTDLELFELEKYLSVGWEPQGSEIGFHLEHTNFGFMYVGDYNN